MFGRAAQFVVVPSHESVSASSMYSVGIMWLEYGGFWSVIAGDDVAQTRCSSKWSFVRRAWPSCSCP